ncbi:hypothetical protein Tco_1136298 [Tanacetum coccineum]
MSNTNNNLQTQTSNALYNAIIEVGGKDRPPMLALGNYIHWKSRIKRYIDTKSNNELIHYCLQNPPYKFKWTEKTAPVAEAEAVQIILTGIDNDIYSIVDACPNAYEMWKAIKRSQQATRNQGKAIVNSSAPIYDQEPATVTEDDEMSKEKEIDKLMALISLSFKKIYKPTNNNLRTSSNTNRANQDNSPRINRGTGVITTRNMGMFQGNLNAEQTDWKDDIDDKFNDQELEAHYMYIAQIQEVSLDIADISGPNFDTDQCKKGDTTITIDSLDMSYDREQDDNDDAHELAQERDLLASFIGKLKYEIDDSKNRNKFLESSHKALVDKLKGEIEDFKTKNKSLESSNNHFKEANNELSMTNQLMSKTLEVPNGTR